MEFFFSKKIHAQKKKEHKALLYITPIMQGPLSIEAHAKFVCLSL